VRRIAAVISCAIGALGLSGAALGASSFGVTDDHAKYAHDGGAAFYPMLHDIGLSENAMTVTWDPAFPTAIPEKVFLDRVVPQAAARGMRLIFSVQPRQAASITRSFTTAAQFTAFLQKLAMTYPQVKDFVVGNEPNQPRFWQPQFDEAGNPAAPSAYEALLASGYDALKAVNPSIRVIGFGLSHRGNDDPTAASNISMSPVRFIAAAGAAYRASGRTRPIMDDFGFHPYPGNSTDSISKGAQWPNASVANLDRIKQALWDAFHGTAQPTVETGLGFRVTEIGWQAAVPQGSLGSYTGSENVETAAEDTQADIYGSLIRLLECDAQVSDVLFFHLIDESALEGFQSGLMRADGSARPAYAAVKQALAETGGKCTGTPISWHHTTSVVGASLSWKSYKRSSWATATVGEDVKVVSAVVRVPGKGRVSPNAIARALADGGVPQVQAVQQGAIKAYWNQIVKVPKTGLLKGTYVAAVQLTSAVAPERTVLFLGPRFRVGR
jgi:hypothetical protein